MCGIISGENPSPFLRKTATLVSTSALPAPYIHAFYSRFLSFQALILSTVARVAAVRHLVALLSIDTR